MQKNQTNVVVVNYILCMNYRCGERCGKAAKPGRPGKIKGLPGCCSIKRGSFKNVEAASGKPVNVALAGGKCFRASKFKGVSLADVDGVSGGEGSTLACSASVALVSDKSAAISESTELSQEASLDCTAQRTGFWLLRLRFDDEDPDGIVALFDVIFTTKLVDEVSYSSRTSQESATLKVSSLLSVLCFPVVLRVLELLRRSKLSRLLSSSVELVSSITWSSTLKSSEFVLSSMLSPSSPTTTMPSPSSSSSSSSISPMCIPPSKPSSSSSSSIIPSEPDICLLS
ncbi:hypothetical protein GQX74_008194, partial [Glossina fuscipes]